MCVTSDQSCLQIRLDKIKLDKIKVDKVYCVFFYLLAPRPPSVLPAGQWPGPQKCPRLAAGPR